MFSSFLSSLWNARINARERASGEKSLPVVATSLQDSVSLGVTLGSFRGAKAGATVPEELRLTTEERRRHLYLLGGTGMGKTSLLLSLLKDDVLNHRGVFLMDARGELVDRVLLQLAHIATPEELKERLLLIDLRRSDYSVPFNPLSPQGTDAYTRVKFVMEALKREWDIGVQTEQLLRNALYALSEAHTLNEVEPLLMDALFREHVLRTVSDLNVKRFFARYEALENRSHWVEPVLNKISPWISRPVLRNLLSQKSSVSFTQLLDKRTDPIILVALSADTLFSDATMIGSLLTSSLAGATMRAERRDRPGNEITFYLDEFENFAGMGEQFASMLAEGRKFGLGLCLSHQSTIQLDPKLRALIRNIVGTQIYFSVGGGEADTLSAEIAGEEPKALMRNLIMNQKVGEAIVVRRGQPFTRIKTHHLADPPVKEATVEALRLSALKHWGRPSEEVEAELLAREKKDLSPPGGSGLEKPSETTHRMEVRDYSPTQTKPGAKRGKSRPTL